MMSAWVMQSKEYWVNGRTLLLNLFAPQLVEMVKTRGLPIHLKSARY